MLIIQVCFTVVFSIFFAWLAIISIFENNAIFSVVHPHSDFAALINTASFLFSCGVFIGVLYIVWGIEWHI